VRATNEEAIDNLGAPARGAERPKPPGGKPLLRMLQLLGQAGYEDAAAAAVTTAVDESQRPEFQEFAQRLAPAFTAPSKTGRARRTKAEQAPAAAEDAANETMRAAEFLGPPTPTGPQWRALGPVTVPNGQTYGSSRINVSGRIAAIAVDPSNPAHVLAGAANGGVWESFDRGNSWAPRTDYAATLAVGAVTFDPSNPRTVYCGLGEGNWWSWLGTGVLRSTDGGSTWSTRCTNPFVGQGFHDLGVDPANSNHLVAATTGGLYDSTDGGTTWTPRRSARTWSVAITGGAQHEILAACDDGLFRSTDNGANYTAVTLPWRHPDSAGSPSRSQPPTTRSPMRGVPVRHSTPQRGIRRPICGAAPAITGQPRQCRRASPPVSRGMTGSWRCHRTTPTRSIAVR
jgi:hypothetical protein